MSFENIIGHEEVKKQLYNSLSMGTISHAHIFCGEDGIGKSIISKEFSINIIGKKEVKDYVDIIQRRIAKGKQSIGISEVLNIIDEINKKPFEGDRKVIIVHEADRMTVDAQNAFLKTIEEPPKGVFIILLCKSQEGILDTIKSRCQIHNLKRLNSKDIRFFLNRDFPELDKDKLEIMISFCDGIPGRAMSFFNDALFMEIRSTVLDILKTCQYDKKQEILKYQEFFLKNKLIWRDVLICLLYYIRDLIIYKETRDETLVINRDKILNIKELADVFSFNKLSGMIEVVNDTAQNLAKNVNIALAVDSMLLNIQEV
ncbi:MAG: DNA polymerase III subunit delta' [Clostridiaceae bacterium]|nr:DNA polymerase III subunit delta' [Clostridiaceae bacterium]